MKLLLACLISTLSYSLASAQSSNAIPDSTSKEPYATFGSMWGINTGLYVDFNDTKPGGRVTAFYRYGLSNEWWQVAYVQSEMGIDYLPASIGGVLGGVWTNKIHSFCLMPDSVLRMEEVCIQPSRCQSQNQPGPSGTSLALV